MGDKERTLVVVDAQNDFISGSLACQNAKEAMENLVSFLQKTPGLRVVYSADWHSKTNGSFQCNGGIWPVHCVAGTEGAALYSKFYDLPNEAYRPNESTLFKKGRDDAHEEYSACLAENAEEKRLEDVVRGGILVAGLASEYCVRETLLGLHDQGLSVSLYLPGVGYVNQQDHEKNLTDLREKGIPIVESV